MPIPSTGDRLSRRALNRALLERQLLLRRADLAPVAAVEHLVGLQAQAPDPPYYALWARLAGFRPADLATPLLERDVVRIVLMRGTVHLVSGPDALALRTLTQPIMVRDLGANPEHSGALAGLDLTELTAVARVLLDEEPLRVPELSRRLGERWPEREPKALMYAARNLLPLVQLPPRGVWGSSGQPTYATVDTWLGRPPDPKPSVEMMIRRYLAAFGPALVADIATWSGLRGLREVIEPMRPTLRTYADERGRELFDLPDLPLPDPDTPAPVRFTAPFDNLVLSHSDRTRVMAEEDRKRLFHGMNGVFPGQVLVDGFLVGTWVLDRGRRGRATVTVTTYRRLSKRHAASVEAEGRRLIRFAAPEVPAAEREVRITPG